MKALITGGAGFTPAPIFIKFDNIPVLADFSSRGKI